MNKTIICFLFLILFFQYKCSQCTDKTGADLTEDDCKNLETEGNTICILGNEACVEKSCITKILKMKKVMIISMMILVHNFIQQ